MLLNSSGSAEESQTLNVVSCGSMAVDYRNAAEVLSDMQRHRVSPTPQAYELWLAYHAASNPTLTGRMREVLKNGQPITPAVIEGLREEFELDGAPSNSVADEQSCDEVSRGLLDAAEALVGHAADGRVAIRAYGEVLAQSVMQLAEKPGGVDGLRVISMLTTETVKMAEHNRDLRERLSTTSARVEKLRRLLADERLAASTDQLTGLPNRRAFNARLKGALAKASKRVDASASLLMFDIDHFKQFNDLYGHSTGDLVLRLVGRLLIESIKGRDIAARYGGEEFAILLIGADLDAGTKVARQICTSLSNKKFKLSNSIEQGHGRVTTSIGVAQLRPTDSLGSVMARADAALYAAKNTGRNRVVTEKAVVPG